jgi:hypothetical protein
MGALSDPWQQVVVLGACAAALLVLAYFLIERRLTSDLPPSRLTGSLPVVLDLILLSLAVTAAVVILAWLAAALYLTYRRR